MNDREPQIGIWWDDGERLKVLSCSTEGVAIIRGVADSDLSHYDAWPDIADRYGKAAQDGCDVITRGREVWDTPDHQSAIIHGNATPPHRIPLIARAFATSRYRSESNELYGLTSDPREAP